MNAIAKLTAAISCSLALAACGGGGGDDSYTVTPRVSGGGGTISPSTAVSVKSGGVTSFTLKPNTGYVATVSGSCLGSFTSSNVYTTKAITADCTVVAAFIANTKPLTFVYESQSGPALSETQMAGFLTLLNQEGAKGYFYQAYLMGPPGQNVTFINDGTKQTYDYELLAASRATDLTTLKVDFITQANTEGAKGYRYEIQRYLLNGISPDTGFLTGGNYALYRKDSGSPTTYTYVIDPTPSNAADFLTQANRRGQSGYRLIPGVLENLYVKDNTSNAIYTYDIQSWPTTLNDFLAQLNNEGTKGYRALSTMSLNGHVTLYIKDQTQAATFTYQLARGSTVPTNDQQNSYGAQGYAYWGLIDLVADAGTTGHFYVQARNCKGFLCTALNPYVRDSDATVTPG